MENSEKVIAATKAEANITLAFTEALREKGYSEQAITVLNCQRLSDKADRFGIAFAASCNGSFLPGVSVAIDPSKVTTTQQKQLPVSATP